MGKKLILTMAVLIAGSALVFGVDRVVDLFGPRAGDPRNSSVNTDESKRRGEVLAVLLEQFKQHHGRYPASIEALERALHVNIERPTVAIAEWEYWASTDGQDYILRFCFTRDCYPSYMYVSPGIWDADT